MIELRNFIKDIKPYQPGKPIEELIRELGITGEVLKMASNENPLGPSPLAAKAINEYAHETNLYPDDNCYYLKNKLSEKSGIPVNQMIVGAGSVELIDLIFKAYVNPGDEVIMSDPSFIIYKIACQVFGGKRIAVPLVNYAHDVDSILKAVTEKTKMVILDNPINPTGTIIEKDKFDYFIKNIPSNVIVVSDEAYAEYIREDTYPETLEYKQKYENLLILRTFSKIYGLAGIRVGYGFSSSDIIQSMMKVRLPFNVNRLAQVAAARALDDNDFVEKSYANNEAGKKFLYKALQDINLKYTPTYANFILVHFKSDATEIYKIGQREGVIMRPLVVYGLPQSLRITIGTQKQNERLIKTLQKITQ